MAILRRKIVTKPFDRQRPAPKQNLLIMPFLWLWCILMTRSGHLKIRKHNMKGLRPPFLVLGTHHSFMDFYVTPLALFPHRANYVSELEGFENFGEWPYRQVGCLGTRKFIDDLDLIRNIKRIMDRRGVAVIYPEARYANVGTASAFPDSVGKLCKLLGVPVVTVNMKGNYLQSPIWNLRKRKGVRLETDITQLFTGEEIKAASAHQIQTALRQALSYNEYAWQEQTGLRITESWRAEGLEMPLYQCPACGQEYRMASEGIRLYCKSCGAKWELDELGRLKRLLSGQEKKETGKLTQDKEQRQLLQAEHLVSIPDWYEWERARTEQEAEEGQYCFSMRVRIEALPNAVNFIDLGEGRLTHNENGFALTVRDYGQEREKTRYFTSASLFSVHTEYDYRGKGECITLSTQDNTYFIFPQEQGFSATKLQFATEYFYRRAHFLIDKQKICCYSDTEQRRSYP